MAEEKEIPVKEIIENQTVFVDGRDFHGAEFRNCLLIYSGGGVKMGSTTQKNCQWKFDGPAGRTLYGMKELYKHGHANMIERTFDYIRGVEQAPHGVN